MAGFELNTKSFDDVARSAEELDKNILKIIEHSRELNAQLANISKNPLVLNINTELFSRLKQDFETLGKTKVSPNFDSTQAERYYSIVDDIVNKMSTLSAGKVELFDPSKLYTTNEFIMDLMAKSEALNAKIKEAAEKYNQTEKPFEPEKFERPRNEKGRAYGKNTKQYKAALAEYEEKIKLDRQEYEQKEALRVAYERRVAKMRLDELHNERKILDAKIRWANMTEAERVKAVQKRIDKLNKDEKKHIESIRKEYQKIVSDELDITKKMGKLDKSGIGKEGDATRAVYEQQLQDRDKRRREIEQNYANFIVDIFEKANRQILDVEVRNIKERQAADEKARREALEAYRKTATGALDYAGKATTIDEYKKAQKYLLAARDTTNVKDTATIDALNKKYQELRITIEELTKAEKNEQTLQPTVRNEYARLLTELDKVQAARDRLSKTQTYQTTYDADSQMNALVARENDIQAKIRAIRQAAQGQLDEIDRKHAAERALNEVREIEKVEARRAELARQRMAQQMAENSKFGTISSDSANRLIDIASNAKNIKQDEEAIKRLKAARENLDKTDAKYERTLKSINDAIDRHKRSIDRATMSTSQLQAEQRKLAQQRLDAYWSKNTRSAMSFSDRADKKSLADQIRAINYLKQARDKLDKRTMGQKEYEKEISRINDRIREQQREVDRLRGKLAQLPNSLDGLQNKLMAAFSLQALKGYFDKLASIRGEFELQQKSLEVLIGNKAEANKLWNQTVQLAVKSPMTTRQLITATKQLKAYRIETDKLHDTTRRLADVSQGLGVDMNRLILAYGQVKAANFLRGTELRQFTEAGVNMLDELANRFTMIEGKMVTAAEVFDRISKRKVTFTDVEAVFKTLTDEGGLFYQMQEKQSETLRGMILNLKDTIELTFNEIGKNNDGLMKWLVQMAKTLVDNWKAVATVIKIVAVSVMGNAIATFARGAIMASNFGVAATKHLTGAALAGAKFNISLKAIGDTIKAHPILTLVSVLAAAGIALSDYLKKIDDANKVYDEQNMMLVNQSRELDEIQTKIEANNTTIKDAASKEDDLKKARQSNLELMNKLKGAYPELHKQITHQKDGVIELNGAIERNNELLTKNILLNDQAKGAFWQEDLQTNAKEAQLAQQQYELAIVKTQAEVDKLSANLARMKENGTFTEAEYNILQKYLTALRNAKTAEEQGTVYRQFYDKYHGTELYNKARKDIILKSKDALDITTKAHKEFLGKMNAVYANFDNQMDTWRSSFMKHIQLDPTKGKENAAAYCNEMLMQFTLLDENVRKLSFDYINRNTGFNLQFPYPKEEDNNDNTNGDGDGDTGPKKEDDRPKRRIKLIQDMRKAYEDLSKVFDKVTTQQKILDSFSDEAKELGIAIKDMDVSTIEGTIEAFKDIEPLVKKNKKAYVEFNKAVRDLKLELEKSAKSEYIENLKRNMDDVFAKYDLGKELEKLHIPKELAMNLFDADVFNLEEAEKAIDTQSKGLISAVKEYRKTFKDTYAADKDEKERAEKAKKEIVDKFSKDEFDAAMDFLKKYEEAEKKSLEERLKNYAKYTEKALSSLGKINVNALNEMAEVEKLYEDIIKNLIEQTGQSKEDVLKSAAGQQATAFRDAAIDSINEKRKEDFDKEKWEIFKSTAMYEQMFDDISKMGELAVNQLLDNLRTLKGSLADLPFETRKAIEDSISKLEDRSREFNPFKTFKGDLKDIKKLQKVTYEKDKKTLTGRDALEANLGDVTAQITKDKERLAVLESINAAQEDYASLKLLGINMNAAENQGLTAQKVVTKHIAKLREDIANNEKKATDLGNDLSKFIDVLNSAEKVKKTTEDWAKELGSVLKSTDDILAAFGVAEDSAARIAIDMASALLDATVNAVSLYVQMELLKIEAKVLGKEMNMALGVIGWIAMALQAVASILTAVFQAHDKTLQRQIDSLADGVEKLEKAFEALEKSIEKAFDISSLKSDWNSAMTNIDQRIAKTAKMISLEKKKKSTDDDAIKDYEDQMAELEEQRRELMEETIESLGGVVDFRSVTREFVDAWYDAFKETGNGLEGLKENFTDFFANVVAEQAVLQGAGKIMQPLFDEINKSLEGDFEVTAQEYANIDAKQAEQLKKLDTFLTEYYEKYGNILTSGDQLSGLQKGIQGITEEQADILAAYWSSVRFFVANIDTTLTNLAAHIFGQATATDNPMISQLKLIASNTTAINNLLSSVTKGSHPKGGQGIKVFIN